MVGYALAGSAAQSHSIAFRALPWLIFSELFLRVRGLADLRSAHPCLCEIALCFSLPWHRNANLRPCRSLLIHAVPMLSRSQRLFAFAWLFPSMPLLVTAALSLRVSILCCASASRIVSPPQLGARRAAFPLQIRPEHFLSISVPGYAHALVRTSMHFPRRRSSSSPCRRIPTLFRSRAPVSIAPAVGCPALPFLGGAVLSLRSAFATFLQALPQLSTPRTSLPWHCLPALVLRIVLCALPQLVEAPLRFSPAMLGRPVPFLCGPVVCHCHAVVALP